MLGLEERSDLTNEVIAKQIVELAKAGEHDSGSPMQAGIDSLSRVRAASRNQPIAPIARPLREALGPRAAALFPRSAFGWVLMP